MSDPSPLKARTASQVALPHARESIERVRLVGVTSAVLSVSGGANTCHGVTDRTVDFTRLDCYATSPNCVTWATLFRDHAIFGRPNLFIYETSPLRPPRPARAGLVQPPPEAPR